MYLGSVKDLSGYRLPYAIRLLQGILQVIFTDYPRGSTKVIMIPSGSMRCYQHLQFGYDSRGSALQQDQKVTKSFPKTPTRVLECTIKPSSILLRRGVSMLPSQFIRRIFRGRREGG